MTQPLNEYDISDDDWDMCVDECILAVRQTEKEKE